MTIDNYTSNQDLLKAISEINKRPDVLDRFLKNHHPILHSELVLRTKFLDEGYFKGKSVPILARMYCLEHDLTSSPTCQNPDCGNPVEWRNGSHKFAEHCCWQCYLDDPNSHHKEEETKKRKYGDAYYNNPEKRVATSRKRYGENNYNNRKKFLETCNEKFGGNAPACSSGVVEKMKRTKEERYGDSGFNNHEKAVITLNNQYGVSNVSQIPGVQDKVKQTNNIRYGRDHINQTDEGLNRIRNTCMEKYYVTHYNQSEEYRSRIPEIRKKMTKKWVLFWNDDNTYISTRRDSEEYNANVGKWEHELQMDSSWEIDLFVFCKLKNGLDVDYQPNMTIPYEYDGETHSYHPDFIINGRIVEVKGDQFFRINESTGQEEMFCPWRYPNWSDDYYKWRCGREEAKHQCMLANDVIILRHIDMNNLNVEMFN